MALLGSHDKTPTTAGVPVALNSRFSLFRPFLDFF